MIELETNTETNYSYNVGGEVKKTVPFTKELREWLLSLKAIGIRFVDTLDELRMLTEHDARQMMCCIENGIIYQYKDVVGADDGELIIRPENVHETNNGRWTYALSFGGSVSFVTFARLVEILQEGDNIQFNVDATNQTITINADYTETDPIFQAWLATDPLAPFLTASPIPNDRTCWINSDISADDTVNRIFKTYANAVTWIQANGALSSSNKWCVKASTLGSITCYDNILLDVNRIETLVWGRTTAERADRIGYVNTYNLNGGGAYLYNSNVNGISGSGTLSVYNSFLGSTSFVSGRNLLAYNCRISGVANNNGTVNIYNCQINGTFTNTAGTSRLYDCQVFGTTTVDGGNLFTYSHQGEVVVNAGTWTNEGELIDSRAFSGNLATTDNDTQKVANKLDTMKTIKNLEIGANTNDASDGNVGAIRYRATANDSFCEMVMQTGASTYEWVVIKTNTW